MKVTKTNTGINLHLDVEEGVTLAAVLGGMTGELARMLPWYDDIADALETKHLPSTISYATEQRFRWFRVTPTNIDGDPITNSLAR